MNSFLLYKRFSPHLARIRVEPPDFGLKPLIKLAYQVIFRKNLKSIPLPSVSITKQAALAKFDWNSSKPIIHFSSEALSIVNWRKFSKYATLFWFAVAVHEGFHLLCHAKKHNILRANKPWQLTSATEELWVKKRTSKLLTEWGEVWASYQKIGRMVSQQLVVDTFNYATLCSKPQCEAYAEAYCPLCESYYCFSHFSHRHQKSNNNIHHSNYHIKRKSVRKESLRPIWVVCLMDGGEVQPLAVSVSRMGLFWLSELDHLPPNARIITYKKDSNTESNNKALLS